MDICTIIAKNYVAQARVLAESFLRHHPDGRVTVLIIDEFEGYIDPATAPFEIVGIDEIGLDQAGEMAAAYDVTELSTAVKPWLLRHLLGRPSCDAITYLDPDIWIFDDLGEVERLALRHGLVLNPHFTAPLPRDGRKPADEDILIAGIYNLGFISLADRPETQTLLDWWSDRLRRECVVDPRNGYFVDQRWIDLVPGIWPGVHVLRDPGYNLAYWNLPSREFRFEEGRYTVDGRPLRFFHFSGFDPLRPNQLSRHQDRIDLSSSPPLSRICNDYAEAVLNAGHEQARTWPYGWDTLPGGLRLDRHSRRLYRRALEDSRVNGSAFSPRRAKQLVAYLTEPDEEATPGSGINRYLGELYRAREDLRRAFPDLGGADADAYADWVRANADSLDIPPLLRPEGAAPAPRATDDGQPDPKGINLAGYLSSELGVGEAARQMRAAIGEAGIETSLIDVPVESVEMPRRLGQLRDGRAPFPVNLVCVNADMVPEFAAAADPALFEGRYTIGMWFWEVAQFPQRWRRSFDPLDEVWVATRHVADAVSERSPLPVSIVPLPVTPALPERIDRQALGMPEGFCFLFVFDYRSVLERKNPHGLIECFAHAFDPGSGVSLVVKSVGHEAHPEEAESVREAVQAHPGVHLIEQKVSPEAKNAMIAACDCYISLHRSEGFGLTMAEAMYFGKPVIATGYSGNLDFMTEENSYLVGHSMTRVGHGSPPYPAEATWAQPDLDHAGRLMRYVTENRDEAKAKGKLAAADIRRSHSPQATGKIVEERLGEIFEQARRAARDGTRTAQRHRESPTAPAPAPVPTGDPRPGMARLTHLLEFPDAPPKPGAGRVRRAAKRIYLRLLRPYVAYQRRINESTAQAIQEAREEIGRRQLASERREADEIKALEAVLSDLRNQVAELDARLSDETSDLRDRSRALEDLERRTDAQRRNVESSLSDLSEDLERRTDAQQRSLSKLERDVESSLSDLSEDLERRTDAQQRSLSKLERDVESSLSDLSEAVRRDRIRLDRIGDDQAESAANLAKLVGDLDVRTAEAQRLVDAAGAPPFTSGDQLASEDHPSLGSVLAFGGQIEAGASKPYKQFEDIFRGSEEMIRDRQRVYIDLVRGFGPVLDVGCGRGEFLDLLEQAGIARLGVDNDGGMVARCHEKGHEDVVEADAVEYLAQVEAGTLGTVFSAQVIEHLEFEQLQGLLRNSLTALRPGGLLVAETVNPHAPVALKSFWVDPTHRQPLFPETMLALCRLAGFASALAFCPQGTGNYERDRTTAGEYAVLAQAPEAKG